MKSCRVLFSAVAVSLLFALPICHSVASETSAREARISRITKSQLGSAMNAGNFPGAAPTLQFVRQTNPNLSNTQWSAILDEVSDTMTSAMSQPGNPMFLAYKKLLGSFSDDELARLENLLNDSVYRKYSSTLTSPTAQQVLMQGMIENSPWMPEALNLALRKRGLKEVH